MLKYINNSDRGLHTLNAVQILRKHCRPKSQGTGFNKKKYFFVNFTKKYSFRKIFSINIFFIYFKIFILVYINTIMYINY